VAVLHDVTSIDDPRCAGYRIVSDPGLAARDGRFVAEGRLVVRRLLAQARFEVESVMVTPAAHRAVADLLPARPSLPVYLVPQAVMNGITGFDLHRGCLAIGRRPAPGAWSELASATTRLIVLERIGNADNVGAIFRNGAALGAGGVLLGPACADPLYRKAIRTSMGAALTMPYADAGDWPGRLTSLRAQGWLVVALTPRGDRTLREAAAHPAGRVAVVAGHEGDGLSDAALAACDIRARIPMTPGTDSMNVATAAAIALYEFGRGNQCP
jgi:tRNA G18 (ribose-2'-O)-methylase SpoU